MDFKFETTLRDALHNAHPACTRTDGKNALPGEMLHGTSGTVYARGIIVGAVSAVMALTGCRFQTAIDAVRARLPARFNPESIPGCWRDAFGLADETAAARENRESAEREPVSADESIPDSFNAYHEQNSRDVSESEHRTDPGYT